jgi:peptide deformylase
VDADQDAAKRQAMSAFIAELRRLREISNYSQKALASLVGYTPSYVSKVERGSIVPSEEFARSADLHLRAGQTLARRWEDLNRVLSAHAAPAGRHTSFSGLDDPQSGPDTSVIVDHEDSRLTFQDGEFITQVRRRLQNLGLEPVTQYLIRIAVDRYPGDPERSNRHHRQNPLTWEELKLSAVCEGEPMDWLTRHDRDAFKELWLLFENSSGRFPLYPGDTRWISYQYSVGADKWGPWWTRAIRLPTRRVTLTLDFPTGLGAKVWGIETSMTARASAFRTSINETRKGDRTLFTWSAEDPPLHTRFRIEWKFTAITEETDSVPVASLPSEQMKALGIVQKDAEILHVPAVRFDLPQESEDARRIVAQLATMLNGVTQIHPFAKGTGLAAPQIGIGRSAAMVKTADGDFITLLNPRVVAQSPIMDEQYEGCLSFFDVRGMTPRSLTIEVEHQEIDGTTRITQYQDGLARLVAHEIDHLDGVLYTAHMRSGVSPIPVSQYKEIGRRWQYHRDDR